MTTPKMKPCPTCKDTDNLNVFTYDSGWRHVECVKCNYLGPGCGTIASAIRRHNSDQDTGRPSNSPDEVTS